MSNPGNQPDSLNENPLHNSQDRTPNLPPAEILPIPSVPPTAATHVPPRPQLHTASNYPTATRIPTIGTVPATESPSVYPTSSPSLLSQTVLEIPATPIQSITSTPIERTVNATSSPVSVSPSRADHSHVPVTISVVIAVVFFTFGMSSIVFWLRQRRRAHARARETTQFVAIPTSRLSFRRKNQEFGGIGASPANYARNASPPMWSTVPPRNQIARADMVENHRNADLSGLPVAQLHMSTTRSQDDISKTLEGSVRSQHRRNISDHGYYGSRRL